MPRRITIPEDLRIAYLRETGTNPVVHNPVIDIDDIFELDENTTASDKDAIVEFFESEAMKSFSLIDTDFLNWLMERAKQ